jgi:hypothetical protein
VCGSASFGRMRRVVQRDDGVRLGASLHEFQEVAEMTVSQ